jgi:hypothetical protein
MEAGGKAEPCRALTFSGLHDVTSQKIELLEEDLHYDEFFN